LRAIFNENSMIRINLILVLALLLSSCAKPVKGPIEPSLIPEPLRLERLEGEFNLSSVKTIFYSEGSSDLEEVAEYFAELVKKQTGMEMNCRFVSEMKDADLPMIGLLLSDTIKALNDEGYYLDISKDKVLILAKSHQGIFYGLQSLRQLLPPEFEASKTSEPASWMIPAVRVVDQPAFPWRGMLFDCARHFMQPEFIKRYIDLLAYHKMNRLHWHLTEDQGWRIEIKSHPELTEIGAWRTEEDGTRYGGYYTQEQIKDIVEYARIRQIEVVPEIELPGHSVAAIATYPYLGCTGDTIEVSNRWGVFKDIYCAGKDSTFLFLQDVLDEVVQLFPYEYIHIGGDEAPKYRWENCPNCQNRMKLEGLKNEAELQTYFITRIEKYVSQHKRRIIGWDEILEGGLAPSATVQSWRGFDGAMEAAHQHHQAIVSPTSHAYFDYGIEGIDLQKVYSFNPIPAGLEKEYYPYILGGECNLWTERAPQEDVDGRMFPRMLAMCEVLWTSPVERDYSAFHQRVQSHYKRLDYLGVDYGFESKAISFDSKFDSESTCMSVELLPGQPDFDMYYTLDGSEPGRESTPYTEPIKICQSSLLKVITMKAEGGPSIQIENNFYIHLANLKQVEYKTPFSPNYPGGGSFGLVDGIGGSDNFRDNHWQGFFGANLDAVIDLGEMKEIHAVETNFLQSVLSWIYMPAEIIVYGSGDGLIYKELGRLKPNENPRSFLTFNKHYEIPTEVHSCRYIHFEAVSIGKNPEWHDAAGLDTWLFCDEIIVR